MKRIFSEFLTENVLNEWFEINLNPTAKIVAASISYDTDLPVIHYELEGIRSQNRTFVFVAEGTDLPAEAEFICIRPGRVGQYDAAYLYEVTNVPDEDAE